MIQDDGSYRDYPEEGEMGMTNNPPPQGVSGALRQLDAQVVELSGLVDKMEEALTRVVLPKFTREVDDVPEQVVAKPFASDVRLHIVDLTDRIMTARRMFEDIHDRLDL